MKRTQSLAVDDKHRPVISPLSLDDLCIARQGFLCREAPAELNIPSAPWKQSLPLSSIPIACKHFVYTKVLFKFPDFSQELSIEARGSPKLLVFLSEYEAV